MWLNFLISCFIFLLGLVAGSFLNCVIYRLETKKSFVRGRSFCPLCKHTLKWQDLIPVFSFLFLKGRCRYCKQKISVQYPLVELTTGLIFLFIFHHQCKAVLDSDLVLFFSRLPLSLLFGHICQLFLLWAIAFLMEIIFVFDLKYYLVADQIIYPALFLTLLFQLCRFLPNYQTHFLLSEAMPHMKDFCYALAVSAGLFFLLWAFSKGRYLGFGDVKIGFLMALLLGWPAILPALSFAFLTGAVLGLILIGLQKKTMKSEIPFGPFLITGTFVGLFFGEKIIQWYLNFFI